MNFDELWINIGNYRTRFVAKGKGEPLVLIHGLGSSLETWKDNIDYLSKYFRVYAFDMIGFGLADKPNVEYRLDLFSNFLRDFLNALKLESVNLVGNSLGGLIALWFSIKNDKKVKKLILESASGLESGAKEKIKKFMGNWWTLDNLIKFYSFIYYRPKINYDVLKSRFSAMNSEEAKHAYISTLNMKKDWKNLPNILKKFKKKTLIIWGENDNLIPVKYAYEFHRLIKNSKLVILPKTGHVPHSENPDKFNKTVVNFLIKC